MPMFPSMYAIARSTPGSKLEPVPKGAMKVYAVTVPHTQRSVCKALRIQVADTRGGENTRSVFADLGLELGLRSL